MPGFLWRGNTVVAGAEMALARYSLLRIRQKEAIFVKFFVEYGQKRAAVESAHVTSPYHSVATAPPS